MEEKTRNSELVETTNLMNEDWRTFASRDNDGAYKTWKSAAECFNELSKIPMQDVQLGDGRVLRIRHWTPISDPHTTNPLLDIKIEGYICIPNKPKDKAE